MVFAGCAFAGAFSANAKTKRIPAGTKFSLELLTPVTSVSGRPGSQFSAILLNDQSEGNDVILPSGSLVRGTVSKIVEPQRMSKGAILYMDFDHVVTPNGRQLPLAFSIVGREDLTLDGGIQNGTGFGEAFRKTMKKSGDITKTAVNWGNETFEAVLVSIDQMVDNANRSIKVYARVAHPQKDFRPGMYVSARKSAKNE